MHYDQQFSKNGDTYIIKVNSEFIQSSNYTVVITDAPSSAYFLIQTDSLRQPTLKKRNKIYYFEDKIQEIGGHQIYELNNYGDNLETLFCCEYGNIQNGFDLYMDKKISDSLVKAYRCHRTINFDSIFSNIDTSFYINHRREKNIFKIIKAKVNYCDCIRTTEPKTWNVLMIKEISSITPINDAESSKFKMLLKTLLR